VHISALQQKALQKKRRQLFYTLMICLSKIKQNIGVKGFSNRTGSLNA